MTLSLAEVLPLLQSGVFKRCEYHVGSAFFVDDEKNWAKLDLEFAESTRALNATYGEPEREEYVYPGEDVSRLACWKIPGGFVYVMLSYQDNTRIRILTLGMCDTGKLQVKKPAVW